MANEKSLQRQFGRITGLCQPLIARHDHELVDIELCRILSTVAPLRPRRRLHVARVAHVRGRKGGVRPCCASLAAIWRLGPVATGTSSLGYSREARPAVRAADGGVHGKAHERPTPACPPLRANDAAPRAPVPAPRARDPRTTPHGAAPHSWSASYASEDNPRRRTRSLELQRPSIAADPTFELGDETSCARKNHWIPSTAPRRSPKASSRLRPEASSATRTAA